MLLSAIPWEKDSFSYVCLRNILHLLLLRLKLASSHTLSMLLAGRVTAHRLLARTHSE